LPPSDLFPALERRPRLFARLAGWDRALSERMSLASLADHHLTIFRHVEGDAP
jgi:hypothetical protein